MIAIIGHTGFVGGFLANQLDADLYNSKNIEEIRGKSYNLIICAGCPGSKWLANQDPNKDLASINNLLDNILKARTERLVLVSTVDVFKTGTSADEDTEPNATDAYGINRRWFEYYMSKNFDTHILRLPGLFGPGLTKNFIFDMINSGYSEFTNSESVYQFYPLTQLMAHINFVIENDIPLLHLATEPISAKQIAHEIFDINFINDQLPKVYYNIRSKYYENYLYSSRYVIDELKNFVKKD